MEEDVVGLNVKIMKYRYITPDQEKLNSLLNTRFDTIECLATHVDEIWEKLENEGCAYQCLMLFDKDTTPELDMKRIELALFELPSIQE